MTGIASELLNPPKLHGRSNGLDLLRGFLSVYVLVLGHVVPWSVFAQGPESVAEPVQWLSSRSAMLFQSHSELNPAVLGFIVLSGYCIHRNGLGSDGALAPFAIRRAFRILPVFWLGIAVGIVMFRLSGLISRQIASDLSGTSEISVACVAAKLTALPSLLPIFHPCDYVGNAPLLTVMVEIGLYACYPLAYLEAGALLLAGACGLSIAAGLSIALFSDHYPLLYNWWQNSSLLAFLPYWWIGAISVAPRFRRSLFRYWPHLATTWVALSALSIWIDPTALTAELRKLVFAALAAIAIVKLDARKMPANPLSLVGRAGYSIYAFHAPVAIFLCLAGTPWWATSLLAILFGGVCFAVFEYPIDRVGRWLAVQSKRVGLGRS